MEREVGMIKWRGGWGELNGEGGLGGVKNKG